VQVLASEFIASGVNIDALLSDARAIVDKVKKETHAQALASVNAQDLLGLF